jgi:stage II sporulation protein D
MAFIQTINSIKKPILLSVLVVVFLFCPNLSAKELIVVRVAVLKDRQEVTLSVSGPYDIIDIRKNKVIFHGKDSASFSVSCVKEGLKVKNTVYAVDAVRIDPQKKISVTVNKRRYRGDISIFKDETCKLCVVNTLDLESYVKGVLYHEISHKWPMDAIKAQAVAVRTYAMYQKEVMKNKNYDVAADTSSQVYGGYFAETSKTNRAVNFTNGEVLLYRNKLFPAFFHATCGGMTENAAELWKLDIEPLSGGRVCGFCSESPHYFWKTQMDLKVIQEKLENRHSLEGALINIRVFERNPTGRVRALELEGDLLNKLVIPAKEFRSLLGPDILRSTNFSIILEDERVVFVGKGWGHGVGLCQWGAFGMSKKGSSYKQILEFYYPGAVIMRLP